MIRQPGEPAWCRHAAQLAPEPHDKHVSRVFRVGDRHNGGEAATWLRQEPGQPVEVGLSVAQMASATIVLHVHEMRALRDVLTRMLQAVGAEKPGKAD